MDFELYLHRLLRILVQAHSHLHHHVAGRTLRQGHDPMALAKHKQSTTHVNRVAQLTMSLQLSEKHRK